jgi:hypothetical protein
MVLAVLVRRVVAPGAPRAAAFDKNMGVPDYQAA